MNQKEKVGKLWLIGDIHIRIKGVWWYLYRGVDENGNLVDVRLSKTHDMTGTTALAFSAQTFGLHEDSPKAVATDGLATYPREITDELGEAVEHEV